MSLSNNDYNWRLVAAEDIDENTCVALSSAGKAEVASSDDVVGICPQDVKSGARCPVIRGGTISGLTGFTAGARLRVQSSDGSLGTAGSGPIVAIVKSEDATTAVILTGNLDDGTGVA